MPRLFKKASVLPVLLSGFLLVGSVTPMQARDRCSARIHKAERNLEKAIHKHGPNSIQAQRQREKVEHIRQHCHR